MTETAAADTPMTYRTALAASIEDAITFGVTGHDCAANRRRFALAQQIHREWTEAQDLAYSRARQVEPYVPAPCGLLSILATEGDIARAFTHDGFAHELREHLGLTWYEHFVRDEDGERWESVDPPADADEQIEQELNRLRTVLDLPASPAN